MSKPTTPPDRIVSRTIAGATAVSRYDLVLAVVPVALLLGLAAGLLSSVPLYVAMAVGSLVGAAAVADALFIDPPTNAADHSGTDRRQEPGD
ncbi:hypothetical protein BRD04_10225 [Halobacteriales archaeon QS_9_67_17]|nr:MAG: hypothetical protein BRD04_10225 [Halobacteriales archaeon QS_9_67_17]